MGMSASQARLLSITARLSHNELESQLITNSKTRLANKTQEANKEYLRALNQEKLMYRTFDAKGNATAVSLTPSAMYTYSDIKNQYGISNASGQLLVSSLDARNYENSDNLKAFLECYGVTDTADLEAQQIAIDGINTTLNELIGNLSKGTSIIPSLDDITKAGNEDAITLGNIEKNLAMLVWGNSDNSDGYPTLTSSDGISITANFADANGSDKSLVTYSNQIKNMWLTNSSSSILHAANLSSNRFRVGTDLSGLSVVSLSTTLSPRVILNNRINSRTIGEVGLKSLPSFTVDNDGYVKADIFTTNDEGELVIDTEKFSSNWILKTSSGNTGNSTNSGIYEPFLADDTEQMEQVLGTISITYPYLENSNGDKIKLIKEGENYYYSMIQYTPSQNAHGFTISNPSYIKAQLSNSSNNVTNNFISYIQYDDQNGSINNYYLPDNDTSTATTNLTENSTEPYQPDEIEAASTGYLLKVGNNYYDAKGNKIILNQTSTTKEKGDITYDNSENYSAMYDYLHDEDNLETYDCINDLNTMIKDLYCNVVAYMVAEKDNTNFNEQNTQYPFTNGNYSSIYNTYNVSSSIYNISGSSQMSVSEMKAKIKEIYKAIENLSGMMTFEYRQQIGEFSGEREWYTNLWYRMNGGQEVKNPNGKQYYKELDDNLMTSDTWLQFALEHGTVSLEQVKFAEETVTGATNTGVYMPNREWATLIYTNATEIVREEDEVAIARAEAKYKTALNEIEAKDKNYDNKLRRLDNEHDAIKTEYDSIKEVLNKNIDRSFKTFS